jgi:F-type H+-transporting ATPase subunit gamma
MANRRDIKRRIGSVINTQKITKAMKLVAAAKFARASHAVNAARPYSQSFDTMVAKLIASSSSGIESKLLREAPAKSKALVVILGTDRGLCGGLNTNLFRFVRQWMNDKAAQKSLTILPLGRKAMAWSKKMKEPSLAGREKTLERPNYQMAKELADEWIKLFCEGEFDEVFVFYNQFVNALTQKPQCLPLLPVVTTGTNVSPSTVDLIVEPALSQLVDVLLSRKIYVGLFQAMLDAAASEFGSRMTAMDSATSNAAEVRKKLALQYNRARQAAITKELIEIISGAEAL